MAMAIVRDAYVPLDNEDDVEKDGLYLPKRRNGWIRERWAKPLVPILLILSLAYNGLQAILLQAEKKTTPDLCRSNFTGLAYDTPTRYETNWGRNETEADRYWESLDASPVAIILGEKDADAYGLGSSVPFPWDDEKQIYYIKAFHHIHCLLKIIRKAFKVYESGRNYRLGDHEHLYHCINTLRQDIMCKPDDTIMPSANLPHVIGDNQVVQCRSWDKLVSWAQHPSRHACHKIDDDDRHVAHLLELYSFCPPYSPYYPIVKAYYEKHGHKPLYDDKVKHAGYPGKIDDYQHSHHEES